MVLFFSFVIINKISLSVDIRSSFFSEKLHRVDHIESYTYSYHIRYRIVSVRSSKAIAG